MYIHSASVKLYLSGKNVVGIGTVSGARCDVEISEANAVINVLADNCSGIASMAGDTGFKLSRAGMHITAEGANALAIGGFNGETRVVLVDSDSAIRLVTAKDNMSFIRSRKFEASGGRTRFIANDEELDYKSI